MPGISKINSNTSSGSSGISKKISFDVGDTFSANIILGEDGGSEITLKTSDGWSFNARVENPNDIKDNDGRPAKFVVTGVEDGEVKIKFVPEETISDNTAKSKDFIGDLVKELGLSKSDVDEDVLKLMIKYNMPLTKENISKMETIVDFNEKLSGDSEQTNEFIAKYLNNKNIAQDSEEGIQITNTLKSLAQNLKGMTSEDMFTLMENNIDITPENIESYKKLFKSDSSIYDELKEIEENLTQNSKSNIVNSNNTNDKAADIDLKKEMSSGIDIKEAIQKHNDEAIQNESEENLSGVKPKSQDENISKLQNNLKVVDSMKEILNRNGLNEVTVSGQKVNTNDIISKYVAQNWKSVLTDTKEQTINNIMNKISEQTGISNERLASIFKDFINDNKKVDASQMKDLNADSKIMLDDAAIKVQDENLQNSAKSTDSERQNGVINKNILNENVPKTAADNVKEQINLKINNMKDIINKLLTPGDNKDLNIQQKISLMLKNSINDFKMFNSISGEYYYMDVPVNNNNQDYQCKLIIKDDRKSGKRIDSKNVKIVTSVKTVNIGVVDAYIAVFNNNMNINIKCNKEWVNTLDRAKIDVVKKISEMGYNINMIVQKKKDDSEGVNLVECRDFFNDNKYFKIDTRV